MIARYKDEYVTVAEAAEMLGVAQSTIRRWIREQRMSVYQLGSRRLLLKRYELDEMIAPRSNADEGPDWINHRDLRQLRRESLTDEEQERGVDALHELRSLGQELNERRDGKPYVSSLRLIHEGREERTRRILGL